MSNPVATRIIEFIKPKLNRRSVAFLLCLLLSGLFWLLMSLSKEYVDEIGIPVLYTDLPEDVLIASELTEVVNAEVKSFGFDLMWYWSGLEKPLIKVSANPAKLPSIDRKGEEFHYMLTNDKNSFLSNLKDNQLEILSISPDTLFLKFKQKYTKYVPIKLNAEISFLKQYGMVTAPILVPDSILVIGSKEQIDTIAFVRTELQSWTDLNESLTSQASLTRHSDLPFVQFSHTEIQVELNVVEFTEGSVTIPLRVQAEKPETVKVFPNEVEIKYQVPLISYDDVAANQFQASVILNKRSIKSTSLSVIIDRQPESVRQVRVSPPQVEYIIQK